MSPETLLDRPNWHHSLCAQSVFQRVLSFERETRVRRRLQFRGVGLLRREPLCRKTWGGLFLNTLPCVRDLERLENTLRRKSHRTGDARPLVKLRRGKFQRQLARWKFSGAPPTASRPVARSRDPTAGVRGNFQSKLPWNSVGIPLEFPRTKGEREFAPSGLVKGSPSIVCVNPSARSGREREREGRGKHALSLSLSRESSADSASRLSRR